MDLNLLVAFDALYRTRSVTKAGRHLGLSQPATSAALARLRDALGDELFVKTPRGLEPTSRCHALAGPVASALAQLRGALEGTAPFVPAESDASFRIGAVDAVLAVLLGPLSARVTCEAPHVRLELRAIDPREAPALIEKGEIDLAIAPTTDAPAHLETRELFPVPLVIAVRPGHPLPRRPTLADLARFAHVMVSFAGPPRTAVDAAFASAGLARHVAVVLSSFLAVPHALAETDLAAIVPAPFARALEARGLVRCAPLPPEIPQPQLRMRMLWSPRVGDAPAWRWMRDVVVDVARERALTSA